LIFASGSPNTSTQWAFAFFTLFTLIQIWSRIFFSVAVLVLSRFSKLETDPPRELIPQPSDQKEWDSSNQRYPPASLSKEKTFNCNLARWWEQLVEGSRFLGLVAKSQNTHDNGDGDEDHRQAQTY
jgi:hypothetical protein